jgi:hypothetical protein
MVHLYESRSAVIAFFLGAIFGVIGFRISSDFPTYTRSIAWACIGVLGLLLFVNKAIRRGIPDALDEASLPKQMSSAMTNASPNQRLAVRLIELASILTFAFMMIFALSVYFIGQEEK